VGLIYLLSYIRPRPPSSISFPVHYLSTRYATISVTGSDVKEHKINVCSFLIIREQHETENTHTALHSCLEWDSGPPWQAPDNPPLWSALIVRVMLNNTAWKCDYNVTYTEVITVRISSRNVQRPDGDKSGRDMTKTENRECGVKTVTWGNTEELRDTFLTVVSTISTAQPTPKDHHKITCIDHGTVQVINRQFLNAEDRVRAYSTWDVWHQDKFSFKTPGFPCQCHPTAAPYSPMYIIWGMGNGTLSDPLY
jgi:hypothetical protein